MRGVTLILGGMRSGKTLFCEKLYREFSDRGAPAYALIEENERDQAGVPVRLWFREPTTEARWDLGERLPSEGRGTGHGTGGDRDVLSGPRDYPPFRFSPSAFAIAASRLEAAFRGGKCPLIVDELGSLEMREDAGLWPWLSSALREPNFSFFLSMRPELEATFLGRSESLGLNARVYSLETLRLDGLEKRERDELASSIAARRSLCGN
jgi:hypothetical protein